VWVCVSNFAHLCLPCTKSADCVFGGVEGVTCVRYGAGGAFCGAGCEAHADCPPGFGCGAAVTVEGMETKQCTALGGLCDCGGLAEALGLPAACYVENMWGRCDGQRSCVDGALTECDAPTPAQEICNHPVPTLPPDLPAGNSETSYMKLGMSRYPRDDRWHRKNGWIAWIVGDHGED